MMVQIAQLKNWFLAPWPDRDLDTHVHMCLAVQETIRQGLLTRRDLFYLFRYLSGYEDRSEEETIKRAILILSEIAELQTTKRYVAQRIPERTKLEQKVKIAEIEAISIWEKPIESTNI